MALVQVIDESLPEQLCVATGGFLGLDQVPGDNRLEYFLVIVADTQVKVGNQIAQLQSNRWDLAMALNETPGRARAVAFSEPVSNYEVSFLYNTENPKIPDDAVSLDDIDKEGVTIALMSGTVQDKVVSANVENAQIMRLPGMDETRLAVMSRRADVLADANDTNMLFNLANSDWSEILAPTPPLARQGVAFGLSKSVPEADIAELNALIIERREAGDIERMIDEAAQQAVDQMQ